MSSKVLLLLIPCKDLAERLTKISPGLLSVISNAFTKGDPIDSFLKEPFYGFIFELDTIFLRFLFQSILNSALVIWF